MTFAAKPGTVCDAPGTPASERMLSAKETEPTDAVAKPRRAPGAMSWTICAMPRPSSVLLPAPGSSTTTTGWRLPFGLPGPGKSPVLTSTAGVIADVDLPNESDITPTVTPAPVKLVRYTGCCTPPWLVVAPTSRIG